MTRPFPPGAPESLRRTLGDQTEVTQLDEVSLLVTGPADATTLAKVSRLVRGAPACSRSR